MSVKYKTLIQCLLTWTLLCSNEKNPEQKIQITTSSIHMNVREFYSNKCTVIVFEQ